MSKPKKEITLPFLKKRGFIQVKDHNFGGLKNGFYSKEIKSSGGLHIILEPNKDGSYWVKINYNDLPKPITLKSELENIMEIVENNYDIF